MADKETLFSATINLISYEGQVVWSRYAAMLVANTIVLAFARNFSSSAVLTLAVCAFGLIVCIAWYVLSVQGWKLQYRYFETARKFNWSEPSDCNPICAWEEWMKSTDYIRCWALAVIWLFMIGYVAVALIRILPCA